ncbi:MAG: hypothetical protein D6791_12680 [Chloroflexi bacterium]|nr:MAG: hypothetical protein D6791_12680 [Chloroflexota bacterium]
MKMKRFLILMVLGLGFSAYDSGPPDEGMRLLRRAEMYLVTVPLRRYNLEPGKVYLLGVQAFGQQMGSVAIRITR